MNLTELKKKSMPQLLEIAESMNLENLAIGRRLSRERVSISVVDVA